MTKEEQTKLFWDYVFEWVDIFRGLSGNPHKPECSKLSSVLKARGKILAKNYVHET